MGGEGTLFCVDNILVYERGKDIQNCSGAAERVRSHINPVQHLSGKG